MQRPLQRFYLRLLALCAGALTLGPAAHADPGPPANAIEVAALLCLTGDETPIGISTLEGIRLAIEEANARGDGPPLALKTYDEQSGPAGGKRAAEAAVASRASLAIGSTFSVIATAEAPILSNAGLPWVEIATADGLTQNPGVFRIGANAGETGAMIATYIGRVLGLHRAAAIVVDDAYGRALRSGFDDVANHFGLDVTDYLYKTADEAQQAVQAIAADRTAPAVVLLMLDADGSRVLPALRRNHVTAPILGAQAFGFESFAGRVANEPEERERRGAISDGLYAVSPLMLDSANAETLAFAARYRAKFGRDPSWTAAGGYEEALAAIAAARTLPRNADVTAQRAAALAFLRALDAPSRAMPGLYSPIWFDRNHGRPQPLRIGRYANGRLESAPLQIVPVNVPDQAAVTSGEVFETGHGRYARLQRVVYAGIYLNEVSHLEVSKSSFGADFYFWLRSAKNAGPNSVDPADVVFPNLLSGSFDAAHPAEEREMPDGTVYRLWRVHGEFRNDYDLHAFPFDGQRLQLSFFSSRAASDRIVYAVDRRTLAGGDGASAVGRFDTIASPSAFKGLTQWDALGGVERRENLVTSSALGDPGRVAAESHRELSGFLATFDVKRRALSTVVKMLMPLLLMTLIIYTTLHFPPVLIKEKVTVAVTGALSGAVLLVAVNNQLGVVGYTIAVEYAFYVFFGLTTFSVVATLTAAHLRTIKRDRLAVAAERGTRVVFLLAVGLVLAGAWYISANAGGSR